MSDLDEDDLRRMLAGVQITPTLDPKRVIARSRTRRLPKQLAAGAVGTLAIAGIFVVGFQSTQIHQTTSMTSPEQAYDSSAPAPAQGLQSSIKRAPAELSNLCGAPLAVVAPSTYGLQLDVEFPSSAPAGTQPIAGTVRLTNTSTTRVSGATAAVPTVTLSQGGIVLWHTNGPSIMSAALVDLGPGESLEYAASFSPVRCGSEDDAHGFGSDLPAVAPGDYQLSALIDFSPDGSMPSQDADLVSGPVGTITIGG